MPHVSARCIALCATTALAAGLTPGLRAARAAEPIKIGVISEFSAVLGEPIARGAQLAADDINAKGGIDGRQVEIVAYDDHSSAADAVRAFQRLAQQDHVSAVVTTFISEVALAVEPWAARLHMPTITPAAASNLISKQVHDKYDQYKYMFEGYFPSPILATAVCDSSHDTLVESLHMKTAAIVSEDADWTKPLDEEYVKCLPQAGLKVVDEISFNPDTTDFTPIFNQVEAKHPDVMIMGIAHVGVQPTVQWHAQQVPIPMAGVSGQASNNTFWKSTNGATEGVITQTGSAPGIALSPATLKIQQEYQKKYNNFPGFTGFTAYDDVMALAEAMRRAGSTDPDKVVAEMEKTDMPGALGRIGFYGRNDTFTHALRYGKDWTTGIFVQWQDGKQVCIWPTDKCPNKLKFPSFVKLQQQAAK
ncbi:MAG TPA: ABC transporter substrate-binding protein [Acetobacteraceae bacterium]|nr:ABC transporter substrate-binding protein [Acetobacteraceae bacterium]